MATANFCCIFCGASCAQQIKQQTHTNTQVLTRKQRNGTLTHSYRLVQAHTVYKSKLNTYETFAIIELVFVAFFCAPKHERPTQTKKVPAVNTQFHCQRDERNYKLTGRNRKSYDDADYDDGSARQLCRCWRCQIGFTNCINY